VTGGGGFIGSHVADLFLAHGYETLVVDDLSTGSAGNVPAGAGLEQIDILDDGVLAALFGRFQPGVVCHLAAQASVTVSIKRPDHDLSVNVRGTFNVCEAAQQSGAPVVFASTGGALYGERAPVPTTEAAIPEPLSPYGAAKLAAEAYVATWGRLHGLPNVVLRLGNVYGPRQDPHGEAGVVAIFSEQLLRAETPVIYGHGEPIRDYVYVADVARAFLVAAESGGAGTFNVATGTGTTVRELLRLLQQAAGTAIEPRTAPLRPGELERSIIDAGLIERELGWRAETELAAGLAATFASYG
jgi:UDP-glucose 4-epimerase